MSSPASPFKGKSPVGWPAIAQNLVGSFPLSTNEIVSSVQRCWQQYFSSKIGEEGLQIGVDIFLPAQATGVILERLIARDLAKTHCHWRSGTNKFEKDVVCTSDSKFSFEIKTSSSSKGIFGNRSTGNLSNSSKKQRTGYYLVINYKLPSEADITKDLMLIRFGWIDDGDWVGQASASGQQASISKQVADGKLITLFAK